MPVDIDGAVIANRRLSADYNVLALAAPAIAAVAQPGQGVRPWTTWPLRTRARRHRPPRSIFQVLCHHAGAPNGLSTWHRRAGAGTTPLSPVDAGTRLPLLGPPGRPS